MLLNWRDEAATGADEAFGGRNASLVEDFVAEDAAVLCVGGDDELPRLEVGGGAFDGEVRGKVDCDHDVAGRARAVGEGEVAVEEEHEPLRVGLGRELGRAQLVAGWRHGHLGPRRALVVAVTDVVGRVKVVDEDDHGAVVAKLVKMRSLSDLLRKKKNK